MEMQIPNLSLVVLIGPSGSGKSTFARTHFLPTEVLSSDVCWGMVCDDENDQTATNEAFEILHFIAGKRLAAGRLTVVDATNVQPEARKPLVQLAGEFHCLAVAVVLNLPKRVCQERAGGGRNRGPLDQAHQPLPRPPGRRGDGGGRVPDEMIRLQETAKPARAEPYGLAIDL